EGVQNDVNEVLNDSPDKKAAQQVVAEAHKPNPNDTPEEAKEKEESKSKWEKFIEKATMWATLFSTFVAKMIPGNMKATLEQEFGDVSFSSKVQITQELLGKEFGEQFKDLNQAVGESEAQKHEYLAVRAAGALLGVDVSNFTNSLEFA